MRSSPLTTSVGLGYSSSTAPFSSAPFPSCVVPRPSNRTLVSMCFGSEHSCILWDNGQVSCAGNAFWGQTGTGDSVQRSSQSFASLPFVSLPRNRTVVQIACGKWFTLIVLNDGTARGFGEFFCPLVRAYLFAQMDFFS